MSTNYQNTREVPLDIIINRLFSLSDSITSGKSDGEFNMRIPAECDRDADLILYEAGLRLKNKEKELKQAKSKWIDLYKTSIEEREELEQANKTIQELVKCLNFYADKSEYSRNIITENSSPDPRDWDERWGYVLDDEGERAKELINKIGEGK